MKRVMLLVRVAVAVAAAEKEEDVEYIQDRATGSEHIKTTPLLRTGSK